MTNMKPILITVYADLSVLPSLRSRFYGLLSEYRKERMRCFHEKSASYPGELAEYCLIEAMLRSNLETELPLRVQTARSGKPMFIDSCAEFSLSHAGSFA
jgi:phosphopantetheinyl transferase